MYTQIPEIYGSDPLVFIAMQVCESTCIFAYVASKYMYSMLCYHVWDVQYV